MGSGLHARFKIPWRSLRPRPNLPCCLTLLGCLSTQASNYTAPLLIWLLFDWCGAGVSRSCNGIQVLQTACDYVELSRQLSFINVIVTSRLFTKSRSRGQIINMCQEAGAHDKLKRSYIYIYFHILSRAFSLEAPEVAIASRVKKCQECGTGLSTG